MYFKINFIPEKACNDTLTKKYHVPLIIDDRVDVALAVDAEGVHLGAADMTVAMARKILGEEKIIGATAKTVPWAMDAAAQGADYLGVGAIYPTTTKVITVLIQMQIRIPVPWAKCFRSGRWSATDMACTGYIGQRRQNAVNVRNMSVASVPGSGIRDAAS